MLRKKSIAFWTTLIAAVLFAIAGFIVPPLGVINSSVLWVVAQFLTFTATILGLDLKFNINP